MQLRPATARSSRSSWSMCSLKTTFRSLRYSRTDQPSSWVNSAAASAWSTSRHPILKLAQFSRSSLKAALEAECWSHRLASEHLSSTRFLRRLSRFTLESEAAVRRMRRNRVSTRERSLRVEAWSGRIMDRDQRRGSHSIWRMDRSHLLLGWVAAMGKRLELDRGSHSSLEGSCSHRVYTRVELIYSCTLTINFIQ